MSGVLIPHPLTARRVCPPPPPAFGAGSIVRKTPDTALYSIYVSTLWVLITVLPARCLLNDDILPWSAPLLISL
jgi:hypothetical protein